MESRTIVRTCNGPNDKHLKHYSIGLFRFYFIFAFLSFLLFIVTASIFVVVE